MYYSQGFEYWSKRGFYGAYSDDPRDHISNQASASKTQAARPVFEIIEPLDGGPGKVVRRKEDDFLES